MPQTAPLATSSIQEGKTWRSFPLSQAV
jgi:hypothetical protein